MRRPLALVAPVALLALAACDAPTPQVRRFAWQGVPSEAQWVRVRGGNGAIRVLRSPDATATVGVTVTGRGGVVREARLVVDSASDGTTLCVVLREGAECAEKQEFTFDVSRWLIGVLTGHGGGGGAPKVEYVLYLPADGHADVSTINGAVRIESVGRAFRARTINGAVQATAVAGSFDLETVNGSIKAVLDLTNETGDVSLKTVNGSITAELPASLDGAVDLRTVNGKIESDFPLGGTATSTPGAPKAMSGVVGTGGTRRVSLSTVNGSARLARRG